MTVRQINDRDLIAETGDGGAGAIVAGLLIVVLLVVASFFYFSTTHRGITIDVDGPKVAAGVTPAGQ